MKTPTEFSRQCLSFGHGGHRQPLTGGEANVLQAVEERQPRWLEVVAVSLGIVPPKLPLEGIHGLCRCIALVVEAIVEGRQRDERCRKGQLPVEKLSLGERIETHLDGSSAGLDKGLA